MCVREVLGRDLAPTATTGNGKFCDAFSFNNLYAFREILTELLNQDKDALMQRGSYRQLFCPWRLTIIFCILSPYLA